MLNIYVLEDHFIQQNRIEEVIHTILKKNNIKVGDFEVFDKPNQLLESITERGSHQLFFLDIQIKDDTKKGLEVAKQIRKNDPYANIVFFTTHSEYLPLTFQYQLAALDFIDKSLEGEDFQKRVESIILLTCKKIQSQNPEDAFRIENAKTVIQVPFHDILYFETSDIVHKVILYTKEEQIEFYGSLSQIEKSDPRLFKCHATFSERLKEEVLLQKDRQMSDLAHYSQQIERLYTDLRRFRHDYLNVLSSIKYGIDSKDIAIISDIYDNILEKTKTRIEGKQYEIANLINIKDEAVKGVLASKILEAQGQSITVHLEVSDVFEVSRMELLDFITVLSIFLDNAIEASLDSSTKQVNVALISGETKVVIVENTIAQESINTVGIFKLGRSSKGEGRGIGLSTVREILGKYPNCSLSTQSKDYRFKQTLKIEDVV